MNDLSERIANRVVSIPDYPQKGVIFRDIMPIAADAELNALAHKVAKLIGKELREGVIASGDQFIASESKKAWIIKEFGADAVEMEGASVAVVCNAFGVPVGVFRSISDSADGSADVSFDEFLEHAAQTSADFVEAMLEKLLP